VIIDVWSDVVCPWCFIGEKRLEKAVEGIEHKDSITISHRAFELQPNAVETLPTKELLANKNRASEAEVSAMQANVCAISQSVGISSDDVMSISQKHSKRRGVKKLSYPD
jgi:hypothetical protein